MTAAVVGSVATVLSAVAGPGLLVLAAVVIGRLLWALLVDLGAARPR
ncbi:MAG: hypothetical protein K6V97_11285 [Actinomycetia bacterium]|nr:hypothetical protein [Actinomycetes bacterium]